MRFFIALICSFMLLGSPAYADELVSWQIFSMPGSGAPSAEGIVLVSITPPAGIYHYAEEGAVGFPTVVAGSYSGDNSGKKIPLDFRKPEVITKRDSSLGGLVQSNTGDSGIKIYPGPVTFAAKIPLLPGSIIIEASGLLCSPTRCLPFDKEFRIILNQSLIQNLPDASSSAWWEQWQTDLPLPYVILAPQQTEGFSAEQIAGGLSSSIKEDDGSNISSQFNLLLATLEPQYFHEALEVEALGEALLFGLIAGLLLNLMPCVLPVISLKFSALLAVSAMQDHRTQTIIFRNYCLLFALGVLVWFLILACLLGGAGWVWGEIFQQPLAVIVFCLLLFVLGLSLFGVFSLPIFDLKVGSDNHPYWQAFLSGVLATLLATPCSGPLLGGVLSWTIRQSFPVIIISIGSIGLGMAIPYCIMAFFPRLVHLLPRPGKWTHRLEQLLGFFLMGSVVYFVTLLPAEWIPAVLMNLFVVAFAAWIWGQLGHLGASNRQRFIARFCAIALVAGGIWLGKNMIREDVTWEAFSVERFNQGIGKEPLLLQFTADWCPSCIAMEHATLSKRRMVRLQQKYGLRLIRVDLTRNAEQEKQLLQALGSESIPVIALFPEGENSRNPVVLRDLVTPDQLKDAMKKTFPKKR